MTLNMLKYTRGVKENAPIEFDGVMIDFDNVSQNRLRNAYIALDGTADKITWTCADGSEIELSASQIKEIISLGSRRANDIHSEYVVLKEMILNGEEVEW